MPAHCSSSPSRFTQGIQPLIAPFGGRHQSLEVPGAQLEGPRGHRVPLAVGPGTAEGTAASFGYHAPAPPPAPSWGWEAGTAEVSGMQHPRCRWRSGGAGGAGCQQVPQAQLPDGAGVAPAFLYYCLCCRNASDATTAAPQGNHPGRAGGDPLAWHSGRQGLEKPPWTTPCPCPVGQPLRHDLGSGPGAGDAPRAQRSSAH